MDATRLGHASPLPAALLQEAAVGYLTGPQRTRDIDSWRDTALAWATAELNGAVRALQPVPPATGTGVAGYQVADYLDQHGRRTRRDQLGPPSLWDALTSHAANASDLARLGQAARDRGLYRYAAALWTTATALGSADAARRLIGHLRQVSPGDTTRAARWAADHASLDDPQAVVFLLWALAAAGAGDAVTALAARAAGHASLDDPGAVAALLPALAGAGAGDAVTALADRAADHASLDRPQAVAELLRALRAAGAGDAVTALAVRAAGQASLDDPWAVAFLLGALAAAGAGDAVAILLARDPAGQASLDDPREVAWLLRELAAAGAGDAVAILLARDPAGQASLDDPGAVAALLRDLAAAGAGDAVAILLARDPAGHASLDRSAGRRLAAGGAGRGRGRGRGHRPGRSGRRPGQPRRPAGRRLAAGGAGARPGPATRSLSCWPATPPARPASTTRGPSPGCWGSWPRPGPGTRSPPWPSGPPARPATRGPSPRCCRRWPRPGPGTRSPPWPFGPPARPATRGPSPRCCRRWPRPGPATRSPPWPLGPPARPASTTRGPSPRCCGRWPRPGPATRSLSCWPATPPARPASTTRGPSPRCCGSWARPGPATRSPPWPRAAGQASLDDPQAVAWLLGALAAAGAGDAVAILLARDPAGQASLDDDHPGAVVFLLGALAAAGPATRSLSCWPPGPPTQVCSVFSFRFVLTRPSATGSGASQTEPRRNPGDGKSRPASPGRGRQRRHAREPWRAPRSLAHNFMRSPRDGLARPQPTPGRFAYE